MHKNISYTRLTSMYALLLLALSGAVAAQTCNPNIPLTKPDSRYTYNAAGDEVTDTVTGLIWKRCAEGMSYSGGTCTGTAQGFSWEYSLIHSSNVVGWRIPNIKELQSLVETACYEPAINQTVFPSTPNYILSASPIVFDNFGNALLINFETGYLFGWHRQSARFQVRLVRGQ